MKQLPKYFVIKREANNPLWNKYIQWLNEKTGFNFDGRASYYGYGYNRHIDSICYTLEEFKNNPTVLTLEEWYECVNGFKLPEKWCVQYIGDDEKILKYFGRLKGFENFYLSSNRFLYFYHSSDNGRGISDDHCHEGYTEITFEQFKKYVLKQDNMKEKEIIGYKLIKPEYKEAALKISNTIGNWENSLMNYDISINQRGYIVKLTEAGVLDLWFEPVYKEEFKMGDWVSFWSDLDKKTYTSKIKEWTSHSYCKLENGLEPFKHLLRKATPEEIKAATEKVISMGSFNLTVKPEGIFHKNENIVDYVRDVNDWYKRMRSSLGFSKYAFEVKDIVLSKTGCENTETKVSQWLAVWEEYQKIKQ